MRPALGSVFVAAVVLAAASCGRQGPATAPVAALANPVLPSWIASISPVNGGVKTLSQVRVIFAKPVAAVQALSGSGPRAVLDHLRIAPALKGHFSLLTPRMIGFVAEQALPVATRVRVTLTAGLRDLDGDTLDRDLAWTFETQPLSLSDLPQNKPDEYGSTPPPSGLQPVLRVRANAAVDPASLQAHARLEAGTESIPLSVALKTEPTPPPGSDASARFDPSLKRWTYELRPQRLLRTGTTYVLAIAPGVEPAYGNVPTQRSFAGGLRTYGPLVVLPTPPSTGAGRFAKGDPAIVFDNPLDPKSVNGAVTISPQPAKVRTLVNLSQDQPNVIAIDPYALDPDATYTVTLAPGIKDVFGQTLGSHEPIVVRTSDFAAGAWAPSGNSVIPAGAGVALNFYATNLPQNAFRSAYADVAPTSLLGVTDPLWYLPPASRWSARVMPRARANVQSIVRIPLQAQLGGAYGALAYGFRTALDVPASAPSLVGVAQLTNLGLFAQWFPGHGIVLAQHLSDGAPARGVAIAVYRVNGMQRATPQRCASGTTDANGEFDVRGVDVERCYVGSSAGQPPNLGIVASQGADVATLTTWSYSGVYRFDVNFGWTSGAPLSRGTIFTDRQMYQPGERGEITGIAYYAAGGSGSIVADRNAVYRVMLQDPGNHTISLGNATTDAYGVFSLPIAFSNQQPLGYYTIDAKGPSGNDINGSLRVAQFKPPNFKLTLSLDATAATAGSTVRADASAAYLFGAPLQGGTAHAYVTRDVATVQPKGWDDFWFGPQWFWPEQTPSFDTDVLQRDLPLDAQGDTSLTVGVPRDIPFPMTYRVDLETTDVSNLSVADSQSFLALPSQALIGLASDAVGTAGKPLPVRVIVTDADGKPIAGRTVHLALQKMTYTSATQEVEGGQSAQQAIEYDTVAVADVTSANRPVTANLVPSAAGPFRVLANFSGAKSGATATAIQVFAFGAGQADWGVSDPNAVAVKLDKKQYTIGDTATALIASPYAKADVYVAVVRGDTLYRTTLRGVGGAARVTFKVTPQMRPNAAVEALVVRRSAIGGAAGGPSSSQPTLSLVGMTGFHVAIADRYLTLGIRPRAAQVAPEASQAVTFTLTDQRGKPARGEIVAMVVNNAILQLSGYRLPDLVQTVFADQPIATIFSDSRDNAVLKTQAPPLEKGFGYGGGYLAGAASTRVRANFRPLAYYGVVKTNAAGIAHVAFAMPDDLTTWRVMAVGIADDPATSLGSAVRFGSGDTTFISTQPLIASPLLPQFARPGDRFDLGVSVSNQTGTSGALALVLKLTGALAFASGPTQQHDTTERAAAGMQAFRFPVIAGTPVPSTFEASASLGAHQDALRVPFEVSDRASTDSTIDSGLANVGDTNVPIALNRTGWVQITLANSAVPQFAVPSQRVLDGDALGLADEAASRIVIASALQRLHAPYHLKLDADPAAEIAASLSQLLSLQRGDGGFAEYANASESDPFVTASALEALAFARSRGVAVDPHAVTRASAFLSRALADPERFKWCASDETCKARLRFAALWALARSGSRRSDFLAGIVAQKDRFDSATQIRLARFLLRTPGWQGQGAALAERLQQSLYQTGRYAVANVAARWGWLGSLTDAQSQMVQLLVERRAPAPQIAAAVRALLAQPCKCGWPTADDTASALTALTAYAATQHLAPSSAVVTVGNATVMTAAFGSTASSQTFTVAASSLHGNAVTLHARGVPVWYTVLYTYPVRDDAPGELAAFRVIRTLADPGSGSPALATMDLAPSPALTVKPGRVFDVGVRVIVDHPVDRLVVVDPIPAGFEAVDTSFRTALQTLIPQSDSWQIGAQQLYRDRVIAYAPHLDPGIYDLHYLVRSVTPGSFIWPGAQAYLHDAPEQFGRSAAATVRVSDE